MDLDRLLLAVKEYHPNPDFELIKKAYHYAYSQHEGQVRASGEPYFIHLYETALLACQLKLDVPSVAAALLHDTIEDTGIEREDLVKLVGPEVADIVEGVSNITRIEFDSKEEKQAENFRKMLIAMAKDIRVILVKLCDRLHNMRTLNFLAEEKRRRKAQESLDIYAPLANRLGIHWVKSEMEDLCLKYLHPDLYLQIEEKFKNTKDIREVLIKKTVEKVKQILEEAGISASISGRVKHYYSIWQKMVQKNLSFEEITDLIGFRVVVPSLRACYETLGVVHAAWKPVPGRFKDYIAMPKPNMYQSLHTTVIGPDGHRIEIQIRTPDMNRIAEEGVAAHWRYKEGGEHKSFDLQWVKELVDTQQYVKNPDEFIQSVKGELFPEEIFVFTPNGDLLRLPFKSTPIDFAYAVHTDVGHTATGAKVNGLMVPLSHLLENGDTVEVITSKNHVPSKDWLDFVHSPKARQRIRSFLKSEERAKALAFGMELLNKELKKVDQSIKKLEKAGKLIIAARDLGFKTESELFAEVGYGKIRSRAVIAKIFPDLDLDSKTHEEKPVSALQRIFHSAASSIRKTSGIKVNGMDNVVVRIAKCCQPLPGHRITGYVTRGRGISVHVADCPQVLDCDPQRLVKVSWDDESENVRMVRIVLNASDRIGLLASVTKAVTEVGADIRYSDTHTDSQTQKAIITFDFLIQDAKQLEKIKRAVEMVPGVIKVDRVIK